MARGQANEALDAGLRARALRLLARREHSRAELGRKLAPHVEEGVDLDALLDDFTKRGWLSEARFIEQTVRAKSSRYGPLKIAHHLREKGIDEAGVACALEQAKASESDAIATAWRSRFGRLPVDAAERARQVRFLQGRGFSLESVLRFLKEARAGASR
jgi:regulatory protein